MPRAGERRLGQVLDAAAAAARDGGNGGSAAAIPTVDGAAAFELYDTFGFPLEITQELAAERGIQVWLLASVGCHRQTDVTTTSANNCGHVMLG